MAEIPESILQAYWRANSWRLPPGSTYEEFAARARANPKEFLAADMVDELAATVGKNVDQEEFEASLGPDWEQWQDDHAGFWKNTARGVEKRAYEFGANILAAASASTRADKDKMGMGETFLQPLEQWMNRAADDAGYIDRNYWQQFKDDPGILSAFTFGIEQTLMSLPEMGMAALPGGMKIPGMAAVAASTAGRIAKERAVSNGHDNPTRDDLVKSIPAAIAITLSERLGAEKVFQIAKGAKIALRGGGLRQAGKRIGRDIGEAAVTEAATEAVQEGIEYYAGREGTKREVDPLEMGEASLAGAVGGLVGGGTISGIRSGAREAGPEVRTALRKGSYKAGTLYGRIPGDTQNARKRLTGRANPVGVDASGPVDPTPFSTGTPLSTPPVTPSGGSPQGGSPGGR